MITVQELFDNGEDVLGCNPDVTFLHSNIMNKHRKASASPPALPRREGAGALKGISLKDI